MAGKPVHRFLYNGSLHTIAQLCDIAYEKHHLNLTTSTLWHRLRALGWPTDAAISTPPKVRASPKRESQSIVVHIPTQWPAPPSVRGPNFKHVYK